MNRFIEEALEVLAEEVSDIRRTVYIPRRDGALLYSIHSIADDIMSPFRVTLDDEDSRLTYILMDELDRFREGWMDDTGDSPDFWFPVSWDTFGVWPRAATADGYLRVEYLAWPDQLIDDLDEPEFGREAHDAAVLFGIAEGLLHQWDTARALDYWQQFVALWRDRKGRAETHRFSHGFFAREQIGDRAVEIVGNP